MTPRPLIALILSPTLLSCSIWLNMDRDALDSGDVYQDPDSDVIDGGDADIPADMDLDPDTPSDGPGDAPSDATDDDPCAEAGDCTIDDDCDDGDACTDDRCDTECGTCSHFPLSGAAPYMDDLFVFNIERATDAPPQLVWTGSEYGLSWGVAPDLHPTEGEVLFRTVSDDGTSLGAFHELTDNGFNDYAHSLVWSGSEYALAWSHKATSIEEVHFVKFGPGGTPGTPTVAVGSLESLGTVDLAWAATGYGLVWSAVSGTQYGIFYIQIDATGTVVGSPVNVILQEKPVASPSITWTGTEFGLVWQDARDDLDTEDMDVITEIYFQKLREDGSKIISDLRVTASPHMSQEPKAAWSGSEFGVTWWDTRMSSSPEVFFARISTGGSKVGTDIQLTDAPPTINDDPSIAWSGAEYGIVYNSNGEVRFIRLAGDGTTIGDAIVNTMPAHPAYLNPAIVWTTWGGGKFAVAWGGYDAQELYFNFMEACDPT